MAGNADTPGAAAVVIVTARDESERLPATLAGLAHALPGLPVVLADDGSRDGTARIGRLAGAVVTSLGAARGKGQAATAGCARALELGGPAAIYLLCDADLGVSSAGLQDLLLPIVAGEADLAIAAPAGRRRGDGLGVALAFARWSLKRRTGMTLSAPISGQRALRGETLQMLLPFAPGFGMELAMSIEALRGGLRVIELPLELDHRRRGRGPAGFAHRARQLAAFHAVHRRTRASP